MSEIKEKEPIKIKQASDAGFAKESQILTLKGIKRIKDVEEGDQVVTQNGRICPVKEIRRMSVKGKVYSLQCYISRPVTVSGIQTFWARTKEGKASWVKAADLTKNYFLAIPKINEEDLDVIVTNGIIKDVLQDFKGDDLKAIEEYDLPSWNTQSLLKLVKNLTHILPKIGANCAHFLHQVTRLHQLLEIHPEGNFITRVDEGNLLEDVEEDKGEMPNPSSTPRKSKQLYVRVLERKALEKEPDHLYTLSMDGIHPSFAIEGLITRGT